jgi:Na+/H+ antiporter NhaD/arsenite permease-like protein
VAQQWTALIVFVALFAIATLRGVHVGVIMFAAACGVGVSLAGMPLKDVVAGFPVGIMVLLVGVTYFFAIAQANGTIDRVIEAAVRRVGDNAALLPFAFFALTGLIAAMGSPLASLVVAPVAMPIGRKQGLDPMLMALAIGTGFSAGGFAPTSLFGIVSYGTARQASIDLNPLTLFAVAVAMNLTLLAAAFVFYGGLELVRRRATRTLTAGRAELGAEATARPPFARRQTATIVCMIGLVVAVVGGSIAGLEPDVGVLCFAFGAALALMDPGAGNKAVSRIDWSTVLLVGGIGTFVGVLQKMGAVDLLGEAAKSVGVPIVAALAICFIGGLVSAFASTTGILVALVPLAIPLVASGAVAGWALICALAVCSSIVDVSPFSTVGATLVATAAEEERLRMTSQLAWWGMSLVVIGPLILVGVLVLPSLP